LLPERVDLRGVGVERRRHTRGLCSARQPGWLRPIFPTCACRPRAPGHCIHAGAPPPHRVAAAIHGPKPARPDVLCVLGGPAPPQTKPLALAPPRRPLPPPHTHLCIDLRALHVSFLDRLFHLQPLRLLILLAADGRPGPGRRAGVCVWARAGFMQPLGAWAAARMGRSARPRKWWAAPLIRRAARRPTTDPPRTAAAASPQT
jgi:hypothetical protein